MGTSPRVRPLFCYLIAMRFLLIFVITGLLLATSLEDSATSLAQKVLTHLMPDEVANVTWRDGATNEVKAAFARALQRRVRSPIQVEVRAFLSENLKGPLLIAEIVRENGNIVEMVNASRERAGSALLPLKLSLIWEQEQQILDVAFSNDQMFVLDVKGLTSYRRQDGQWHSVETNPIASMPLRDPRGRIDVTKNPPAVQLPGQGGMFTAGRNTMSEEGWPPHYAHVELAGEHLLAETDGRVHVYDANKTQLGTFDGWGSDFALISPGCSGQKSLASEASSDGVALYGIVNHQPIQMSDVVPLSGPITAIWPQGSGAVVIAKNSKTGRYEAYSASMDCRN
jgi:hypothetical protein